ncbi:MAG: hypothetical protein HZA20_05640 [Nitrospirae bacterium]|nr:hypothetical protein [Nitrospirota bacterium]
MAQSVTLCFIDELNDFLKPPSRGRDFTVSFPEPRSLKDLIESVGVPHTEAGSVFVNGSMADMESLTVDGDMIRVCPQRDKYLIAPRFIADVHLGRLARRLRLLGLDCLFNPALDDAGIAAIGALEGRIVLTRDRRLLMRRAVTHGIFIRSGSAGEQIREVTLRVETDGFIAPLTRCPVCNGRISGTGRESVIDKVPPKTYAYYSDFSTCGECGKVYWRGAHWTRLEKMIASDVCPSNSGIFL